MTLPADCSLEELSDHLEAADIRLAADGGTLRFDAPAEAAGPALEAALRRHKPALLTALAEGGAGAGPAASSSGPEGPAAPAVERERAGQEQRGMLAHHERSTHPESWNISVRVALRGPVVVGALHTALSVLFRRHQALRSRFTREADGEVWQEVLPPRRASLPVTDLRTVDEAERARRTDEECAATAAVPFDLSRSTRPVARLLRTGEDRWTLLVVIHHIACDGWALSLLLRELATLYRRAVGAASGGGTGGTGGTDAPRGGGEDVGATGGGGGARGAAAGVGSLGAGRAVPPPLAPASMQCTEYARFQHARRITPAERLRRLAYWAERLAYCPHDSGLPTDRPRPAVLSGLGGTVRVSVPPAVLTQVREYARRRGSTAFAVTTGALGAELARLSGRRTVVVNISYANRPHRLLEGLVTMTARTLPLRLRLPPSDGEPEGTAEAARVAQAAEGSTPDVFGSLTAQATSGLLEGVDHLLPLSDLGAGLREHHGMELPAINPLSMTYQNSVDLRLDLPGIESEILDEETPTTLRDCTFGLVPMPDGSGELYAEYSSDLFDHGTVEGWLAGYVERLARETAPGAGGPPRTPAAHGAVG